MECLKESADAPLTWLPCLYRMILMFLSGVLYCKLNDHLTERINRKKIDIYKDIFKILVVEDRAKATRFIDETIINLNTLKESTQSMLFKTTKEKMDKLTSAKEGLLKGVCDEMLEFREIYGWYKQYNQVIVEENYILNNLEIKIFAQAITRIASNVYLTNS